MLIIDWQRKGPNEDIATYKQLRLRHTHVGGKDAYFIYFDDELIYSTSYYHLFLKKVIGPGYAIASVRSFKKSKTNGF